MRYYTNNCFADCSTSTEVDIRQNENSYVIDIDIPGMNREDVSVKVIDNKLVIESIKKEDHSNTTVAYDVHEWTMSDFKREFYLAEDIDRNSIEAHSSDGVLTITLLKTEEAKPKEIQVEVK